MEDWIARLALTPRLVKVLVEDVEGDILKARLPGRPAHPRALLTVLEGLALWSGSPLCAVLGVGAQWSRSHGEDLFGVDGWPDPSMLVGFDVAGPAGHRRCLRGMGDFREVRKLRIRGDGL